MNSRILQFLLLICIFIKPWCSKAQIINQQDSLALVELYNSADGPNWTHKDNWLTSAPLGSWYGVTTAPGPGGTGTVITRLEIRNVRARFTVPASIGQISTLTVLDLSINDFRNASVPSLAALVNLVTLDLSNSFFAGNIPAIAASAPLQTINLNNNKFTGNIPLLTGHPDYTTVLNLSSNLLAGTIPLDFGRLQHLQSLFLNDNRLTGDIPGSLGKIATLQLLLLGGNQLSGSIPDSIGNLSDLQQFNADRNRLTGNIPDSLGKLSHVIKIDLSKNLLTGPIPGFLSKLITLNSLFLNDNQLTGVIPGSLGKLTNLQQLTLNSNQLTGKIPDSLGQLSLLFNLTLNDNQLSDTLPGSLGNLIALKTLDVSNNQLTGRIPESLGLLTNLEVLYLFSNRLTGNIPASLGNYTHIRVIYLYNNQLSGPVPITLSNIPNLIGLIIFNNRFIFDGMETLPVTGNPLVYYPQASIPLSRNGNLFSVTAGGTLSNNTFNLYKDGVLNSTKTGDSVFSATAPGRYYITVTNSIATLLTLVSDTITITGLVLADATESVTKNIATTDTVNIQDASNKLLVTLKPTTGANALIGDVTAKVTIDDAVASYNGQPYVQRHYDIMPAGNAENAKATVKLYFTQQEFNNYNLYPVHGTYLPTGPFDVSGKANLRVLQYHGFSATGLPGSYSGTATVIDPDDIKIVWNAGDQYWEVSFDVNGFSGFFVSSAANAALPLNLVSFNGKIVLDYISLQWVTANEVNTSYFEVQRSTDARNFDKAGTVSAAGRSSNNISYQYADRLGLEPVYYYRLKMVDKDGYFKYSNIIKLNNLKSDRGYVIYPNPVRATVFIKIPSATTDTKGSLVNMEGRVLQTILIPVGSTQGKIDIIGLPGGVYNLVLGDGTKIVSKVLTVN